MGTMECPKCGFRQDESPECIRCGIIIARYTPRDEPAVPSGLKSGPPTPDDAETETGPGPLRRMFRIFRWAVLGAVIIVLILILKTPALPEVDSDNRSAARVTSAMQGLDAAARSGRPYRLALNEADLNYWMQSSLALEGQPKPGQGITDVQKRAANRATGGVLAKIPSQIGGAPAGAGTVTPPPPTATVDQWQPTVREVQGAVRAVRIHLEEDRVNAFLLFELFGKDMSLELEGRLMVRDGYLRMEPVSGRLGSFPIPRPTLNSAVRRLFDSPENKENFRVDPHIQDIRIEDGHLIMDWR